MKRTLHSLATVAIVGATIFGLGTANAEVIDIDSAELQRMSTAGIPVVDIRTAPEWLQTGVIPDSRLLTFFDEKGNVDTAAWLRQVQKIAKPSDPVILICRSGNRTKEASRFLSTNAGYARVYNVRGGIKEWISTNRPTVPVGPILSACKAADSC